MERITLSELKKRGWTRGMIEKYLPAPTEARNPIYRNAAPMKLYDLDAVKAYEETEAFADALNKRKNREQGAKNGLQTKQRNTEELAGNLSVALREITIEQARTNAIAEAKNRAKERAENNGECFWWNEKQISQETINRWTVNYLRHVCSAYEGNISETKKRIGHEEAYSIIRNKVLEAIGEAYPELREECEQQRR